MYHFNVIVVHIYRNQQIHVSRMLARISWGLVMTREYIARDPRTGKPLNVGKSKSKKQYIEAQEGPWLAIKDPDIVRLANGEISQYDVSWRSKNYELTREDGIIGLTRIKGLRAVEAHASLLMALEDDSPSIRVSVSYTHLRAHET